MEIGVLYIIIMTTLIYPLFDIILYIIYRLDGGKLGFFSWLKKIEF